MGRWRVADVMTVGAVSVQRDTPFRELVEILELHGVNAVPVVDDERRVLGVVSSADLLTKMEFADDDGTPHRSENRRTRQARTKATGTAAGDLMTAPAVTVLPGTPVVAAAKAMDRDSLKRLPVVDNAGRLVGIVTRQDLLRVFLRPDAQIRAEIVDEVLDEMPGIEAIEILVAVDDGVVTLLGQVDRRSLVPAVVRQVGRVDGVVDVVSHLTWALDDSRPDPVARRVPVMY